MLKFLPRKALSRAVGAIVQWQGPSWWARLSIRVFAFVYSINLEEAAAPVSEYPSLGEFFVRRLKPEARPLSPVTAVHCADGVLLRSGVVQGGGTCIQAKGKDYFLRDLLVDEAWKDKFAEGLYLTYYLCPTDYHRVHSPIDGLIRAVTYIPGDLWPVHEAAVECIDGLYGINERIVVEMATEYGAVAVVFVGATNVGSIELAFDRGVAGQRGLPFTRKIYEHTVEVAKGSELGSFRMGSTVIVLFSADFNRRFGGTLRLGPAVKVNSALTSS